MQLTLAGRVLSRLLFDILNQFLIVIYWLVYLVFFHYKSIYSKAKQRNDENTLKNS